ncbi:MAG: TRAP transporter small permease subunit [Deltaproteobacteria bacterium]|nr:TRAP transporter small permease subunit [Deltaproteobacteria bacterium]
MSSLFDKSTIGTLSSNAHLMAFYTITAFSLYEVISRRFFNAPNIWSTEVIDFIYGPHFMLIAAYTLLYKGHVKIDVIYDKFSPRTRGILDIITYMVFFFPFCIIVLHQGIIFAHTSWSIGETSDSAALKIVPLIKTMIPVSIGLLLIQGIATYIRAIVQAIKGEEI